MDDIDDKPDIRQAGKKIEKEFIQDCRNLFSTPTGKRVLKRLLFEWHFFYEDVNTEEGRVLRNYATRLLKRIGALQAEEGAEAIVNALMKISIKKD